MPYKLTFVITSSLLLSSIISYGQKKELTFKSFQDSVKAKLSESSLVRLKNDFLQKNKRESANDSLNKEIISLYPKGTTAATQAIIGDFKKAEASQFSIQEFSTLKTDFPDVDFEKEGTMINYYYGALTTTAFPLFLKEDSTQALKLIDNLSADALNSIAWEMVGKGEKLNAAEKLSKLSLDKINSSIEKTGSSNAETTDALKSNYAMFEDTYALILFKKGNVKDALKYEEEAYNTTKGGQPDINTQYITYLNADGQTQKAFDIGSELYKTGKGNKELKTQLESAYTKLYPSKDVKEYFVTMDKEKNASEKESLKKELINLPSHDFTLKDLKGNTVSLKALKGKIVILDFWATWCGPCKMSFPGMQLALNKYKDNKDVVFLFVDTWENTPDQERFKEVSSFIKEKGYTFQVLLDSKSKTKAGAFDVVGAYGVDGIPTKFIIGKDGNIKFKMVGYKGSDEGVLEEVSSAIELLKES